jgi:histidinol-phosphatase (PHP family)
MNYNYHTHTFRCNHANGTPEEYIQRAIENGIEYMGFSEHFPYICRDGFEARYRLPVAQLKEYFEELYELREMYAGWIDLKIGFELEYYPELFDIMLKNAISYGAEYLILGQHFIQEEHPDGVYAMTPSESEDELKQYVDCVVAGIKSGVFTYIAHPDLFNYVADEDIYRREMKRICIASLEYNIPLEINFLGIRTNRNYPNNIFWEIAGEVGCPVTFGFDAHDTLSAFDEDSFVKANDIVETYNLNYIGMPKLILLKEGIE